MLNEMFLRLRLVLEDLPWKYDEHYAKDNGSDIEVCF